ncbi:hypothetical protein M9H77_24809 [Catharanthus roseus]|uniref:Uncharacterized protein n=1 Tax=Catharanthus roseus TaxID=4058 RepID=A0ACC0A601_CATRO|nr:hypothetical protein M9H77_24809 [Catharanthus roseus]
MALLSRVFFNWIIIFVAFISSMIFLQSEAARLYYSRNSDVNYDHRQYLNLITPPPPPPSSPCHSSSAPPPPPPAWFYFYSPPPPSPPPHFPKRHPPPPPTSV